ncbi:hypothetical protein, partial [Phenylobacterium sp.]|uniref:hypothetical protein n=1 Tax=Phenylobacterium sp. TaxID=1871053 RepID=UPI0027359D2C
MLTWSSFSLTITPFGAILQYLQAPAEDRRSILRGGFPMADGNITKHVMYGAVAPDDFESMLDLDR